MWLISIWKLIEGYFSVGGHLTLYLRTMHEHGQFVKDFHEWSLNLFSYDASIDDTEFLILKNNIKKKKQVRSGMLFLYGRSFTS